MRPRRIGPIPLLQGVQLDPPTGKPGGLLDARNMEARDGHLQTRRGISLIGDASWDLNHTSNPLGGSSADRHDPTGSWNGQSVVHAGWDALTPIPGMIFRLLQQNYTGANATEFDSFTLEYSTGDGWKKIPYVWMAGVTGVELMPYQQTDGSFAVRFMCPRDWATQDLNGSVAHWLRLSFFDADGAAAAISGGVAMGGFDGESGLYVPLVSETRDAEWVPFRSGERIITYMDDSDDLGGRYLVNWETKNELASDLGMGTGPTDLSITGQSNSTDRPEVSMLYVPAIDRLLVAYGSVSSDARQFVVSASAENIAVDSDTPWPDTVTDDTAWQDVPVNGGLGAVQDMALFNQRVFVAGFGADEGTVVRWSAPSEFATIMPTANEYRLAGGGGGRIVGMAVVHRTLYIFTETAIWSVHEIDPIEGEDSRMIFNLVEETGCIAKRSIAVVNGSIFFLATDAVRKFDGQRSRIITGDVAELFDTDGEHPMAIRKAQSFYMTSVYDPIEEKYYLFYRTPGSRHGNNSALVISTADGSCWLWGGDTVGTVDASESESAQDGRIPWGIPVNCATFDPGRRKVFVCTADGLGGYLGGPTDFGMAVPWRFETHHIGLGNSDYQVLERVDLEVTREEDDWTVNVSIIPDGRLDRKDTRPLGVERDGIASSGGFGGFSAAGGALAEVANSYVPVKARYKSRARNHRVCVESASVDDGFKPYPIRVASLSVNVIDTGRH